MSTSSAIKRNLLNSLRLLFKPIIRLYISQGITHREFSDVAKEIYVEMAIRAQLDETRTLNKSHISVVTGLTRKQVKFVIDACREGEINSPNMSRPGRVLYGWHIDIEYIDADRKPKLIPFYDSGDEPSFTSLVKRYSGDQSPRQLLAELTRVGAIEAVKTEQGKRYRCLRRVFEAEPLSEKLIARFGLLSYNLLSTQIHNLTKPSVGKGRFERAVHSTNLLDHDELEAFAHYMKVQRGQPFLQEIDDWLSQNSVDKSNLIDPPESLRAGVALVEYITERPEELTSFHELLDGLRD